MTPIINYVFLMPDWHEESVTPFQGFTTGILDLGWALSRLTMLPGNIVEWSQQRAERLAARAIGLAGWRWFPLIGPALPHLTATPANPFWVIFSDKQLAAEAADSWIAAQPVPVLHFSSISTTGSVNPDRLSPVTLQNHCRQVLTRLEGLVPAEEWTVARDAIDSWKPPPSRWKGKSLRWLGPAIPNEVALQAEGLAPPPDVAKRSGDEGDQIESLLRIARRAGELRQEAIAAVGHDRQFPLRPDTILFAPAMYRHFHFSEFERGNEQPRNRRALRCTGGRKTGRDSIPAALPPWGDRTHGGR